MPWTVLLCLMILTKTRQEQEGKEALAALTSELEERISVVERRLRAIEHPVWQVGVTSASWSSCAEGPCKCWPETKSLSCWGLGLLDLPTLQVVPKNLLKLDLSSNQLLALHKATFEGLDELYYLDINDNQIKYLPISLLFPLYNVTHLRLSRNFLRELDKNQLIQMQKLEIFLLVQLSTSGAEAVLKVSTCALQLCAHWSRRARDFKSSIGVAASKRTLLDLSSNKLHSLPEDLFSANRVLALLDLSSNQLSRLSPSVFRGLLGLEELLLSRNHLSALPIGCFRGTPHLKRLVLEENLLEQLPQGVFAVLASLQELNLSKNKLATLPNNLLVPLAQLRILDLSSNHIQHISQMAFWGLQSLKELELDRNRLREIARGVFKPLTKLENLVLHGNNLQVLQAEDFAGLRNLTSLALHSNQLKTLHPMCLKNTPRLRTLQLESNYLSHLPKGLFDTTSELVQVRLGQNPWHCDCASYYLAGWLRKKYPIDGDPTALISWEIGAGAVCRGPSTLGGELLARLTYHELCNGEWASMKGLSPRLPVELGDEQGSNYEI